MLSIHHGDVHYADRMASRPLPVQSGSSASCIELNYVDDGHQAVINAALAARETSEVSMDGHTLEALTSEAPYRPEDSHPGARATGAAVAAGSKSAVCRLSTTSTFECCQKLFNSQTLRWRKRRKGVRDQQENLEAEQRYESCAADDESSPAHACATSSSLPAPAISSLRPRQPLESYRRKPFFSNVTVAVACIMYWAATATLTSAYHSAGETIFGQGTCKATGPSHFEVTCTDGGLFKDSNGKSAYKRCAPILCPPFVAPENSVPVPLNGADPAKMKLGDEVEVKCNIGYVYRGPDSVTNRTQCVSSPACTLLPTKICVYNTFCPLLIDPQGVASGKWFNRDTVPFTEVTETRDSAAFPDTNYIFNREYLTTTCNSGYRSSLPYIAQSPFSGDGACPLFHQIQCSELAASGGTLATDGQLAVDASCVAVTCPPFNTTCTSAFCGSDLSKEIATLTPNITLAPGESTTIQCNQGYYLPVSPNFTPNCTNAYSAGGDLTLHYTQKWTAMCSLQCNYNAPPRPCEPVPCPCLQVPTNAVSSKTQLVYHETSTYTCNTGYAVRGTTAQQCLKTKDVKCVLDTAGLSVLPSLPSDHCSSAPCGRYTPPANAVSNQIMNAGVHNDTIVGTCNSGYRAYVAQIWSNCFTTRTFPITCDDCRWQDAGATCKKVICNAPTIRNGFTSAQSSDFGNPITVTCNEGYRPDTSNVAASRDKTITCTDTCAHSPVFRCKPVSSTPSFLSSRGNASYIGLARWTGDLAVNETGTEVLESDGTIRISLSYGGRATFLCNKGYVSSGNLSKCTRYLHINGLADGTLRGADQYCKRVECNTDTVANAWYVQPSKIELGKNATVTCAPGYRSAPKGREFMSCADDNTYSIRCAGCHLEADMECVPVKCDTTYSIVLGNATQSFTGNYSKLLYGQTLAVRCSAGYRLNTHDINGGGFGVANCAQNCQLSGNLTCLPLLCDMTALPNQNVAWEVNGLFENGMYYGESGKMVCNAGYNADVDTCLRSFIVGCSSDGTLWNSDKTCNNPTKCTKPQSANAVISSNLSLSGAQDFGATATITCNFGYGAQTVPSMYAPCNSMTHYNGTCSQDCAFEGSMSCVPYRCPLSDLTTGLAETGSVNYSIPGAYAYYGDPVTITCNTGYSFGSATSKVFSTSAGCSTSQCGSFSTSGSSTLCIALTCDGAQLNTKNATVTPSAANTLVTGTMLSYDESYDFKCNTGYMLASGGTNLTTYTTSFTSTCSADGDMSGLDEYCIPISCTTELDENAGTISSSSGFTYGNNVTLTCNEGYRASTGTMSYCGHDVSYTGICGIFSISTSESCKSIWCTGLANIRAGLVDKGLMSSTASYYEYGDKINITCNEGYMYGSATSTLQMTTLTCSCPWEPQDVQCVAAACDSTALPPKNSTVTTSGVTGSERTVLIGQIWTVTCNSGFYIKSSPANSTHYKTSFNSTCVRDGMAMSHLDEECALIACGSADLNQALQTPASGVTYGTSVNVTCLDGYRAASVQSSGATCSNEETYQALCGTFDYTSSAKCKRVVCNLTSVQFGLRGKGVLSSNVNTLNHGHSVDVTCNAGYRFGGQSDVQNKSITCGCPWLPEKFNCTMLQCDLTGLKRLVQNTNGTATLPSENITDYGTTYTVQCDSGFGTSGDTFVPSFTSSCGDNGVMTNLDKHCVPGMCKDVADPNQASQAPVSPQYYGTTVLVTCNTGFRASATFFSSCDNAVSYDSNCSGYSYTPLKPNTMCQQTKCGDLNSIRSSLQGKGVMSSNATDVAFGESFTVTCNTGYRFASHSTSGPSSATVSCDCPWSPARVNCSSVHCLSNPFPPANSSVTTGWADGQKYTSYGSYTVQCNRGYLLHSGGYYRPSHVTIYTVNCGDNGLLTSTAERCEPVPCDMQADPNQLSQDPVNGIVHNNPVVVTCNAGYRASASASASATSTCAEAQTYDAKCDAWEIVPVASDTSCKRIYCDLETIRSSLNGLGSLSSSAANLEYNASVKVDCFKGSRFGGSDATKFPRSSSVKCGCPWVPNATNCTTVQCVTNILAPNAKARVTDWAFWSPTAKINYGTELRISCNIGYYYGPGGRHPSNFSREYISRCQNDGNMSNVTRPLRDLCERFTCEKPLDIHSTQQCANCSGVTCSALPCPTGWGPSVPVQSGQELLVTCNTGFRSSTTSTARCSDPQSYGALCSELETEPISSLPASTRCRPLVCDNIGQIRSSLNGTGNMNYSGDTLPCGSSFNVTCNTGYRFGNPTPSSPKQHSVMCDCPFDVSSLTCLKVQCDATSVPPAGATVISTHSAPFEWQTTIQVQCNPGYIQANSLCRENFNMTCNSDGAWMSSTGSTYCEQTTLCYDHVENCSVGHAAVGLSAEARCPYAKHYRATCLNSCTYNHNMTCKPVECNIPTFHGTAVPSRIFYNETITAVCSMGYRFKSTNPSDPKNVSVRCHSDCELAESLDCRPIICNASALARTSELNIDDRIAADFNAINFTLSNFTLGFHDTRQIYCRNNTIVETSLLGVCASTYQASCADDGGIKGSMGSLKCVPKFCNLGLLWDSNVVGNVTIVYDENLTVIPNSQRGVVDGAHVTVACNEGYRILSHDPSSPRNQSTSCQPNCNFAPPTTCKPVGCPASSMPPPNSYVVGKLVNGRWVGDSTPSTIYFGETLNISCNPEHMVASSPEGTCRRWFLVGCNDTGLLVGAHERCVRVNCGDYEADENRAAMIPSAGAYTGDDALVQCKGGYRAAPVPDSSTSCISPLTYSVSCGTCQYHVGPRHYANMTLPQQRCAIASCRPFNLSEWGELRAPYLHIGDSTPFHGQSIDVPCAYAHRAALASENYAQCFRNTSLEAKCDNCGYTSPYRCKLVVCDTINNASTMSQGLIVHGNTGNLSCRAGYRAGKDGELPPTCSASSTFRASCTNCQYLTNSTKCSRVMCNLSFVLGSQGLDSILPKIPYAVFEDQITVSCLPGFRPLSELLSSPSSANTSCLSTCAMTHATLTDSSICSPIACPAFSVPASSSVTKSTSYFPYTPTGSTVPSDSASSKYLRFGDEILVKCDNGYTRASLAAPGVCHKTYAVTCSDQGQTLIDTVYQNESCVPIFCSRFDKDANMAYVNASNVEFGRSATVTCKTGYLAASSTAQCGMSATYNVTCDDWQNCSYSVPPESCAPVECPIPAFEGTPHPARSFFNERLVIACKSAYRFKSKDVKGPKNHSLSCNKSCSLSETPICLPITCNASWLHAQGTSQFNIKNRTFAPNLTLDADQEFEFHCNGNLIAKGSPPGMCSSRYKVSCVDDGSIASALGSFHCVPKFCDLRLFEAASSNWEETVVYLNSNGSLSRLTPNINEVTSGGHVLVSCKTGHRINTGFANGPRNASTTCNLSNCNFAAVPVCKPVLCNASVMPPLNAHVIGRVWSQPTAVLQYGDLLNVSCDPLYMVAGSSKGNLRTWFLVSCNDTGHLVGTERCIRANCGEYKGEPHMGSFEPQNGSVTFDQAEVTCAPGFRQALIGNASVDCSRTNRKYTISCASDLGYYASNPMSRKVCAPLKCGPFDALAYAGGPKTYGLFDTFRLLPGIQSFPAYSVSGFSSGQVAGYQDGGAQVARLQNPLGLAIWPAQSQVLIVDEHHVKKLILDNGTISTLSGSNAMGYLDEQGTRALFHGPGGIAVARVCEEYINYCADLGFVPDSSNHRIRRISMIMGNVTTVAGSGIPGFSNGMGTNAKFNYPQGIILGPDSSYVFIADSGNNRIRKMTLDTSDVSTFSGTSLSGLVDGSATAARFSSPQSFVLSPDGKLLYVADAGNHAVREVNVADGSVKTLAGSGTSGSEDGVGTNSRFHFPSGLTITPDGARLLIADTWNNKIRSLHLVKRQVFTVAGTGSRGYLSEGTEVAFNHPSGILYYGSEVFVADSGNNLIRSLVMTPTNDSRLIMTTPYRLVPSVAHAIHGQNVSLECGNQYRSVPLGVPSGFCSGSYTANATCDECVGGNALASYSGEQCVPAACDPISNVSTRSDQIIFNGAYGRVSCNPGYRAINGTLRAANKAPDCSYPHSFWGLCSDCGYDMRSKESNGEWITCDRIQCNLQAIRAMAGVRGVLPNISAVFYREPIEIECGPGYRPQDHNVSSPMRVVTNCSDRCTTVFPDPVCKPVRCPAWNIPANSHLVGIDKGNGTFTPFATNGVAPATIYFPQKLKVRCAEGYKLASNPNLISCQQEFEMSCNESAVVVNANERCIPFQCPMINPENGYLPKNASRTKINFNAKTEAACNVGYRPVISGQTNVGCKASTVFEMKCGQCDLISDYQCVPCSFSGKCPAFQPRQDTTILDIPFRLQRGARPWSRGPYNLTETEEVSLACEAGFAAVVPHIMLYEEDTVILDGAFTVRCEEDGTLSSATARCGCLPPAITVNTESGDFFSCVCPAGYYGTIPFGIFGSIDCERCPANSSSVQGTSTLDGCKCNAGYYSEDVTDCKQCPEKSYSNPGSRKETDCLCAQGTYRKNSLSESPDCIYCPAHSDSDFDSRYINKCICNAGYEGIGETGCHKCNPVSSTWRQVVCDAYDEKCVMRSECDCRASYYGNGVNCTICPGGATSMPRTKYVTGCVCPEGTYLLGAECASCPPHSTSPVGSTDVKDCLCDVAYYFDRTINECQSCPPMKISQVGSNSSAECFCDYIYRPENGTCYACPVRSDYDQQLDICICRPGYLMQGPADDENSICVACTEGKYYVLNKDTLNFEDVTTCVECFENSATVSEAGKSIDDCLCLPGYSYPSYCDGDTCGPCQQCPAGKYSDSVGRGPCTNCFYGSFTSGTGAESSADCTCNIGFEAVDAGCQLCAAGTFYAPNRTCLRCKANTYSSPGSTSCYCNAGFSPSTTTGYCTACPAGTYKSSTGSGTCTVCRQHSFSVSGSSICLCYAGYEFWGGDCHACPQGKYKTISDNSDCLNCLPQMGTANVASTSETACQCLPGWFEVYEVPTVTNIYESLVRYCSACQSGKYKHLLGPHACSDCPPNAYTRLASISEQDCQCSAGSTGDNGARSCSKCPLSTYKSSPGTGACQQCPTSRVTIQFGSDSVDDCICSAGTTPDPSNPSVCLTCALQTFKSHPGSEPCQACTTAQCETGLYRTSCQRDADSQCTLFCTNAPPNSRYTSGGVPFFANNCEYQRQCELPFKAMIDQFTREFLGCGCAEGYEGTDSCLLCEPGFYKFDIGTVPCRACDRGTYQNERGQTACADCPPGAFTADASSTALIECACNAGYTGVDGGHCTACPAGSFSPIPSSLTCTSCASGTYSALRGSYECLPCTPNSRSPLMSSSCSCNAGYQPSESNPPICIKCPAGKYKASWGMTPCAFCSTSALSPATGEAVNCLCRAGYYAISNASEGGCSACPPGYFSNAVGSTHCTACAQSTYQESEGQSSCDVCPIASSTASTQSSDHCDCKCNSGFRWEVDVNATGNKSFCPAATDNAPCKKYCSMNAGTNYLLSPASSDFVSYPILGHQAHLTCKVGNRMANLPGCKKTTLVQCSATGNWNQDILEACTPLTCPFTAPDMNAKPDQAVVAYNKIQEVTCYSGYELSNPSQPKPYCDDTCTMRLMNFSCMPKTCIYNLSRSIDTKGLHPKNLTTQYPNSISLSCKDGMVSTQNCRKQFNPECKADANFSFEREPCTPVQCAPPYENFASITENDEIKRNFGFNLTARLQCKNGFVAKPLGCSEERDAFTIRCGDSGCNKHGASCVKCHWQTDCTCVQVTCPPYTAPPNAIITDTSWSSIAELEMGREIKVSCMPGFQIVNTMTCEKSSMAVCNKEGTMEFPGCEPIRCHHNPADFQGWSRNYDPEDENDINVDTYVQSLDTLVLGTKGPTVLGETVTARCKTEDGYRPAGISVQATCKNTCLFTGLPTCVIQKCDAYMPMSRDGMKMSTDITTPKRKKLGDSFMVECKTGFYADDFSVLPGLESLGSVMVLAFAQFDLPDPLKSSNTVFALEGLYSMISISVPPGAWPADLSTGPNAAVFTPPGERRRAESLVVGPYISFGPAGANFSFPITITCAFNLTGIDEGNLEIRVHKFDAAKQTFTPLPYPYRSSRRQGPVDRERGSVEAAVTEFDPPYIALATRIAIQATPESVEEVVIQRNTSNQAATEEPESSANPLFLVLSIFLGFIVVTCCFGAYFAYSSRMCTRKEKTEALLEEDKKTKKNKKTEKMESEKAANNVAKPAEIESESTVSKLEADLVVVDNGVVEVSELPAKNATKLRKESSVKAEVVIAEQVTAAV